MTRWVTFDPADLYKFGCRMVTIKKVVTEEGESIPYQTSDLECGTEADGSNDSDPALKCVSFR